MDVDLLVAFAAGLLVACVASPVGVSGAVFLLPIQLSVLGVANPAVTPTNLTYNVIATPAALFGLLSRPDSVHLAKRLLLGTVPGTIAGATLRVYVIPGAGTFKIVAGLVLLSIGSWLLLRSGREPRLTSIPNRRLWLMATAVGVVGGIYGIGGGSILSPLLVASGMAVGLVAPAALATTFVTSLVGAASYVVLSLFADGSIAPDWAIGLACGFGGLLGNYLGAALRPHLPETRLRLLLGLLAAALGVAYLLRATT